MGTSGQLNNTSSSGSGGNCTGASGRSDTKQDDEDKLMYFKVEDLTKAELEKAGKKKVLVNEEEIALIYHNNKIYAVQEKCPHYGGPLHEGDIEDIANSQDFCIRCPWHAWKFNLTTGQCVSPKTRDYKYLKTYPIRLDTTGQIISLGFDKFAPEIFKRSPP